MLTPLAKTTLAVDRILDRHCAWIIRPGTDGLKTRGMPTHIVFVSGLGLAVLCKGTDKGKPTPLQQIQLAAIQAAGGATYVATPGTLAGLDTLLRTLKGEEDETMGSKPEQIEVPTTRKRLLRFLNSRAIGFDT